MINQLFNEELTVQITEDIMKGKLSGTPHIYLIAGKAFHNMKNNK
jgi:myosin heavy subunit